MTAEAPNPSVGRHLVGWKKFAAILVMLLIGLMGALAVCEIAVRLFVPPFIMPRWVENAPWGIRKHVANIRGYIITPQYRNNLTTNSKGFRGTDEYAIPKPPGVYRVLALGDSVVCGYGVEDNETFCAQLQKKLSSQRRVEVMNLGIPGFSNAEELIQLESVGLDYQPDLVVLGYFVNDPFENLTCNLYRLEDGKLVRNKQADDPAFFLRDRLSRIPGYIFVCQHSYFVNYLRQRASGFFRTRVGKKQGASGYTDDKPTERELTLTAALVDEIIHVCDSKNIPIIVLNIPMEKENVWMKNMPTEKLALRNRAKIVDVATEVWNKEPIRNIAHEGSYHPKARGHELIADWLASFIKTDLWQRAATAQSPGLQTQK